MRRIYLREILKVILITILVLALLVCILWGCIFITDYHMFRDNKPTVFTNSHIETTENGRVIYEDGLFYHIVTNEKEERTLYLFNKEVNLE